jgi:hypothetical protein
MWRRTISDGKVARPLACSIGIRRLKPTLQAKFRATKPVHIKDGVFPLAVGVDKEQL